MERARIAVLGALAACAAALGTPAAAGQQAEAERDLVEARCTLCHTSLRVYTADSANLREVVERMTAKNPEWFRDADSRHLMEALERMLGDPEVAAMRRSWEETVARGRALFSDPGLGTTGKACADCHAAEQLGRVRDAYPRYDPALGRPVSLEERLNAMVVRKMAGQPLAAGDERVTALALYLRSLR